MDGTAAEHIKEAAQVVSQYCDVIAIRAFAGLRDKAKDEAELVLNGFKKYVSLEDILFETIFFFFMVPFPAKGKKPLHYRSILATSLFTNSKNCSSSSVNGSGVFESISICPIFSPLTNKGTTISAFTVILQAI